MSNAGIPYASITSNKYCWVYTILDAQDDLRPEINKDLQIPHLELDPAADEVDPNGKGVVKVATITNVETTGSSVRYTCIYTDDNLDHLIPDNHKLSKFCTIKFENGKLVLRVYPTPEFRNQFIGVMARR